MTAAIELINQAIVATPLIAFGFIALREYARITSARQSAPTRPAPMPAPVTPPAPATPPPSPVQRPLTPPAPVRRARPVRVELAAAAVAAAIIVTTADAALAAPPPPAPPAAVAPAPAAPATTNRRDELERASARELRQLLKGIKGNAAAVKGGKGAMIEFALAHNL